MKNASWIVLALLGGLLLVGSLVSASLAYRGGQDSFGQGGPTLSDLSPEIATAVRGRRVTASAYSASFALLWLAVVLVPYRRGEVWAFWALLASIGTLGVMNLLRIPLLGTTLGAGTGGILMGVGLFGLLLDVTRLRSSPSAS